jgi:hypothetical protein
LKVAGINANELEDKASFLVDGLGVLSLVAAIRLAVVALADLVALSTVAVTARSGSGEEEEGGDGGDGEDASKHGV